jgi:hypothetical protein
MDSCDDTPKGWVAPFGHPRINACSRLPVAFRSVPRPSSPPGAKASTECPSLARDRNTSFDVSSTMHRNHPQRPTTMPVAGQETAPRKRITLAQHTTVASEHHCHRRDAETSGQTLRWQRPETHQNLIHPDKERHPQFGTPPASQFHPGFPGAKPSMPICFRFSAIPSDHLHPPTRKPGPWWR